MAEPGLSLGYPNLQVTVGIAAGWGGASAAWTADQTSQINEWIQAGYRQFLTPPILPGEKTMHVWSFLKPRNGSIATVATDGDYDLPADFGGFTGSITVDSGTIRYPITLVNEGRVHGQAYPTTAGRPYMAALRPKEVDATIAQRFELIVYPVPDAVYTISYRYAPAGDAMSAVAAYPMGGAMHAETLLESCLAVAESRMNDAAGIHYQRFIERLRASVAYDRQLTSAATVGYNADRSDDVDDGTYIRRSDDETMHYYHDGIYYPPL